MALSDSCSEFLRTVSEAAAELARAVHHYSDPDYPLKYGPEIDALRRSCAAVVEAPYDPEACGRLVRLAASVMRYHDTPPGTAESSQRKTELNKLIGLLHDALEGEEAEAVGAIVENVAAETPYTQAAAERLKRLLPKLGKSAYEIAVKIISDVGSATAKKILGL